MSQQTTIQISELVKTGEAVLKTGPFGTQLKASDYVSEGTPVINVRNVGFGEIREGKLEYLDERMLEKLSTHTLERGDIVFGRKGAVERHAFINNVGIGWVQGSDCLRLRIKSKRVNNEFVSHYFRTSSHQSWMQAVCSFGATMASLNQDIVKLITLPAPPYEAQRKIAAILSTYDDLIETNKRRIALLEGMAEEIYREWFVRFRFPGHRVASFKKGVPSDWKPISIEKLLERITPGKRYEQNTIVEEGSIPVLDQGQSGVIGYHNDDPGVIASNDDPVIVFANHTCYQRLIFYPFSTIQNVLPFKPSGEFPSNILWLHFATNNTTTLSEYKGHWPEFISKQIFYPGADLTEKFGRIVKPILLHIEKLLSMNGNLIETRNNLLPRLISGKLSVEDLDIQFPPSMLEENESKEAKG